MLQVKCPEVTRPCCICWPAPCAMMLLVPWQVHLFWLIRPVSYSLHVIFSCYVFLTPVVAVKWFFVVSFFLMLLTSVQGLRIWWSRHGQLFEFAHTMGFLDYCCLPLDVCVFCRCGSLDGGTCAKAFKFSLCIFHVHALLSCFWSFVAHCFWSFWFLSLVVPSFSYFCQFANVLPLSLLDDISCCVYMCVSTTLYNSNFAMGRFSRF
jgi:hypothetical protein